MEHIDPASSLIEPRRRDSSKPGPSRFLYLSNNSGARSNTRCLDACYSAGDKPLHLARESSIVWALRRAINGQWKCSRSLDVILTARTQSSGPRGIYWMQISRDTAPPAVLRGTSLLTRDSLLTATRGVRTGCEIPRCCKGCSQENRHCADVNFGLV